MWTKVFGFGIISNREPLDRITKVTRRTDEMVCVPLGGSRRVGRILLTRVERIRKPRKWCGDSMRAWEHSG